MLKIFLSLLAFCSSLLTLSCPYWHYLVLIGIIVSLLALFIISLFCAYWHFIYYFIILSLLAFYFLLLFAPGHGLQERVQKNVFVSIGIFPSLLALSCPYWHYLVLIGTIHYFIILCLLAFYLLLFAPGHGFQERVQKNYDRR